ncbi:MAG: KilA-N domain-containing protein, partial [Prolixibacteraceae bacterium]|nr:KilA-N domain-containing protein [Prolixibacteraceae bacterium]
QLIFKIMEASLQRFYEGSPITFNVGNDGTMVNATEMAKPFGKKVKDWLRLDSTKELIEVFRERQILPSQLVNVQHGVGTWLHEDLAMIFAQWLSPRFYIWCNSQVKEMLQTGLNAITRNVVDEYNKMKELEQAKEQRLFWSRKVRRLGEDIELIRERRFSSTVPNFQPRVNAQSEPMQYSLF